MVFRGGRRGRGRRGRGRGKEREGGSVVARRVSRGNYGRLTANQGGRGGLVIRILQSLWGDQMNSILTQQKSSFTS